MNSKLTPRGLPGKEKNYSSTPGTISNIKRKMLMTLDIIRTRQRLELGSRQLDGTGAK